MFPFLIQIIYDIFSLFLHGIRAKLIGYSLSFSSHSFQLCSSSLFISIVISLQCQKFLNLLLPLLLVPIPQKLPTSNSHSHSIQITTIRLNENNFLRWSQYVRMYNKGRGKIGYLIGDTKEPTKMDLS